MQPPVPSNSALRFPDRNCNYYIAFLDGELVYQELKVERDTARGIAARQRMTTVHQNIMSLCMEERELLKMKLPARRELQLRSQIMALPWEHFLAFVHKAPLRQQMGLAQAIPEDGPRDVPEVPVSMPVSGTVSTLKTESNDDTPHTPLKSSTSMTHPTVESESHQAANGSTKRKREASAPPETPTNTSASETKNARDARQSKRKHPSTARSAQHKHILAQFSPESYNVHTPRVGDDWEEFSFGGEKRLVGWQWLNGHARRVIKCPLSNNGMRWLYRKEELALEKAGLRLLHEEGMGEEVVENA